MWWVNCCNCCLICCKAQNHKNWSYIAKNVTICIIILFIFYHIILPISIITVPTLRYLWYDVSHLDIIELWSDHKNKFQVFLWFGFGANCLVFMAKFKINTVSYDNLIVCILNREQWSLPSRSTIMNLLISHLFEFDEYSDSWIKPKYSYFI